MDIHGFEESPPPDSGDTWSLFVAGDVVTPTAGALDEFVAPTVARRVAAADLSVANLEAPIRGDADPMPKSGPTNHVAPETPGTLSDAGFDLVTLANNHAMDYGAAGLDQTRAACAAAGLNTVGAGDDAADAMRPYVTDVAGTRVAVCNVCEREFGVATDDEAGTAWVGHPSAHETVRRADDYADVVVVVAHGGVEFVPTPPPGHRRRLHELVRDGADVVVSHHPHVPQGMEYVDGTPVYYSLGNFHFGMGGRPATQWGLTASLQFDGGELVTDRVLPVETVDGTVHELGVERDRAAAADYLTASSATVDDDATHEAYWQEVAERVFLQRYTRWLRRGVAATLADVISDPAVLFDHDRRWDPDERREGQLVLLNLLRNESHRELLETALSVRTGKRTDRRTEAVQRRVRDLFEWTEDRPLYDRPSTAATLAAGAKRRLIERLPSP